MKYTPENIKEYIGQFIRVEYTDKFGYKNSTTMKIIDINSRSVLFDINDEWIKITLRYEQIINISKP